MPKSKIKTRSYYVKKLDAVFSQYIRLRKADPNGYVACVTCGKMAHWKEMQCGHYETRGSYGTRWDEENCHVQCYGCNVARKGNYPAYSRYLIQVYGADILDKLAYKAQNSPKLNTGELMLMIDDYTQKVSWLTKRVGYATM